MVNTVDASGRSMDIVEMTVARMRIVIMVWAK
jgi:hypothetical protein